MKELLKRALVDGECVGPDADYYWPDSASAHFRIRALIDRGISILTPPGAIPSSATRTASKASDRNRGQSYDPSERTYKEQDGVSHEPARWALKRALKTFPWLGTLRCKSS